MRSLRVDTFDMGTAGVNDDIEMSDEGRKGFKG